MIGFRIPPPRSISSGVKGGRIREAAIPRMMQLVKDKLGLQRWSASDCSLERITSRNVPKLAGLASKKVGLVGCGTIGSHLARMMRSEEHTSELQSLMRISYAVFCLKKKQDNNIKNSEHV